MSLGLKQFLLSAILAILGIVAAVLFYFLRPPVYKSEAKLLIRYVVNVTGTDGVEASRIKTPDSSGDNIINSEIEILTSLDLCEQVAASVGPDKILGRAASTNELPVAAALLRKGLRVVPKHSNVLEVRLQHRDPEVTTRALGLLVEAYLRRHVEVHRAIGATDTVLSQQTDLYRTRLAETERALRRLATNFVGGSIEDARKELAAQLARIRQDSFAAQAQLAESTSAVSRNTNPSHQTAIEAPGAAPVLTFDSEKQRLAGLQARIAALSAQSAQVKAELGVLDSIEGEVRRLQRTRELEEKNYRYYAAGIEQARADEAMAGGRSANISIIQAPTPPVRENGKSLKIMLGIALGLFAGGLLGAFALAFLHRSASNGQVPTS